MVPPRQQSCSESVNSLCGIRSKLDVLVGVQMRAGCWRIPRWARMRSERLRSRDRYAAAKIAECHVRLHLAPHLSGIKLGELRPSHVSAIAEELELDGTHASHRRRPGAGGRHAIRYPSSGQNADALAKTIRNILSTLSYTIKFAVNDDLLRSNPVRDAETIARQRDEGVEELVVFDTV